MATAKALDRFLQKLDEARKTGEEVARLDEILKKHEGVALRELLRATVPLLPYLDGPIATREEWAKAPGDVPSPSLLYREPGIVLVNKFESTVGDGRGRMRLSGYKVVLTRSGKLVQIDREGAFGEGENVAFWSSQSQEIEADDAFAEKHLEECVASVTAALERALPRHKAERERLRARLKLLRAVAKLLGGDEDAVGGATR